MKLLSKNFLAAAAGLFLAVPISGFGATVGVSVINFAFVPATTNINVGDTVLWTWPSGSNNHNVTSTSAPQAWPASATMSGPATFSNTFTTNGTFPYECTIHLFTGQIIVKAPALPPTISITNPPDGANLSAPASITLAATASDADGTVTNVQFFQGATSLGNMATSPYSVPVNNLAAADYTFSAVATDNAGLTATNAITIHVVTALPIVLSAPQFLSSTDFRFDYTANPGLSYIIQRAPDLSSGIWTTLSTNVATGSPMLFDDTAVSGSPAFYRVGLLPNP